MTRQVAAFDGEWPGPTESGLRLGMRIQDSAFRHVERAVAVRNGCATHQRHGAAGEPIGKLGRFESIGMLAVDRRRCLRERHSHAEGNLVRPTDGQLMSADIGFAEHLVVEDVPTDDQVAWARRTVDRIWNDWRLMSQEHAQVGSGRGVSIVPRRASERAAWPG